MKEKGILFSGSKENIEAAKKHVNLHGILYWCLPVMMKYQEYTFPITGLVHMCSKNVCYECIITDVMKFNGEHFKDCKKKPEEWIKDYKSKKRKYVVTLVISKMISFEYKTKKLKKCNGDFVGNAPQGYAKILLPTKKKKIT